MSVQVKIPDNARVRFPVAIFASSNLDIQSNYNFENAGNANVTLMENTLAGAIYLIERYSFSANVAESDWLSGMQATPGALPRIVLRFKNVGASNLFSEPFPCTDYVNGHELVVWAPCTQKNDSLVATMYGKIAQVQGDVGDLNLKAKFGMTIYEINDKAWLQTFNKNPTLLGLSVR
jgi:hypothetical protein